MKFFLIATVLISSSSNLRAQTILFQENFTTGIPSTWAIVNADGLTPNSSMSNFTNAWIPYQSTTDTCAASTSYYSPAGQSSDFLITPKISLNSFTKLVWSARSVDASFAETYVVLISATDSLIASFTDTLMIIDEELYYWQKRSVHLDLEGYTNQEVYIAFKNISDDKFILLIDNVKVLGSDFASITTQQENEVVVFPNPTSDFITINNFAVGDQIVVYSLDGQVISTCSSSKIDLTDFAAGTYIVTVTNDSGTSNHKIVKQ